MKEEDKMLTVEDLGKMPPHKIFASGSGLYPEIYKELIRWVAVRGGIDDWAIYYHRIERDEDFIRRYGHKCHIPETIKKLVPCNEEAFKRYRH